MGNEGRERWVRGNHQGFTTITKWLTMAWRDMFTCTQHGADYLSDFHMAWLLDFRFSESL